MPYELDIVESRYCTTAQSMDRVSRRIGGFTEDDVDSMTDLDSDDVLGRARFTGPNVDQELCLDRGESFRCPSCRFFSDENNRRYRFDAEDDIPRVFDPFD